MQSLRRDRAGFPEYAGQYRLESVLGSGGMGVVHLATSASGLKLAVKIVHPEHAVDPEFRARFRQEVAAARRVSGAFTAPVVDADPDAERPWMATLFIDAPTLAERVRERVLDPAELARLGAGLAEALRDIHRAGVVHRDLKPSNVLMAPDGVRVIDFGISRPTDSDLRTETGKLIGTPPFMAPEQFQRPREVGPAADLFAMGAVLVHAATGRGPFDSDSPYLVAYQVVHHDPDLTGLPAALRPVVESCLAKDPSERPTPDALISELRALAYPTSEDTRAFIPRPRGPNRRDEATHRRDRMAAEQPGPTPPRRRSRLVLSVVGALLLTGGALGGYLSYGTDADPSAHSTVHAEATAPGPGTKAGPPWAVHVGERGGGNPVPACSWSAGGLYCSGPGLAAARLDPANGSVMWSVRRGAPASRMTPNPAPLHAAGLVFAVDDDGRGLQALDAAAGAQRWKRALPEGGRVVPVGSLLLVTSPDGKATMLDAATGATRWEHRLGGAGSAWLAEPDLPGGAGLYLCAQGADGKSTEVSAVDATSGAVHWQVRSPALLEPVGAAAGGLYLLEGDTRSASGAVTRAVVRVDLATRAVRRIPLSSPLLEAQAAVGPEGRVYVFGTSGALAAVGAEREEWRLETGVAVGSRPMIHEGRIHVAASDGRLLAVDGAGRLLGQTKPRLGGEPGYTSTLPAPVVGGGRVFTGAPDGSVFAVGAGNPGGW
ncbi:PQQ-binding-like beta-propeller repeat protein [Streptomyces sp. NPDC058049]|uniref:serine/threonine-protein kinase n=1 Tax=Streptomyces sp. NPDC058049 TaxID=3346314 RepID=UPI0036F01A94